ncbi:MAG TPA: hypothetical protein VJ946_14960, partial [Bacteroidales bacterium]|nr:hypothetical protein [Bacteroidales bacterium]
MAEKTTLVPKNPPVETSSTETAPDGNDTFASTRQPQSMESEITITGTESIVSYSFLANTIIIGCVGFIYAVKAARNTKSVNFKACAGFATFAILMSAFYFIMNGLFTKSLWHDGSGVSLTLRAFVWAVLGSFLFIVLSMLDSIKGYKRLTLFIPVFLAAATFGCIGAAHMDGIGQGLQLAFSAIAIVCSGALTLAIFAYLAELPDNLDENFIKGFQIVVIVIACGWLGYPLVNMASVYVDNRAMSHLLINILDGGTIVAMAYGMHACMRFKVKHVVTASGKKLKKPK